MTFKRVPYFVLLHHTQVKKIGTESFNIFKHGTALSLNFFSCLSQLSDKDLAYLEERIKHSAKNRPNTAPTENTATKNVSARGGSDSSLNGSKKKDEKRPAKAAQITR